MEPKQWTTIYLSPPSIAHPLWVLLVPLFSHSCHCLSIVSLTFLSKTCHSKRCSPLSSLSLSLCLTVISFEYSKRHFLISISQPLPQSGLLNLTSVIHIDCREIDFRDFTNFFCRNSLIPENGESLKDWRCWFWSLKAHILPVMFCWFVHSCKDWIFIVYNGWWLFSTLRSI